jgi:hypothetical protein
VRDFPGSAWAAEAAWVMMEDAQCRQDAGYPDCLALRIRDRESWLREYPRSGRRLSVLRLLAEDYLALAAKYEEDRPWRSQLLAELLAGRSLELAGLAAAESPASQDAAWAAAFILTVKSSGRPYSGGRAGAVSHTKKPTAAGERRLDDLLGESGPAPD